MRRDIIGFSNPLLKEIRGLREKKLRKRAGLFLAEGLRIMTEAREAGFLPEMLFRVKDRPLHDLEVTLEAEVLAHGGIFFFAKPKIIIDTPIPVYRDVFGFFLSDGRLGRIECELGQCG